MGNCFAIIGFWVAMGLFAGIWKDSARRWKIVMVLAVFAIALFGIVVKKGVVGQLLCADLPAHPSYISPSNWVVDRYGVGHSIADRIQDDRTGPYLIVLLYDNEASPRVDYAEGADRAWCTWEVARAYRSQRDLELGSQKSVSGWGVVLVTHWSLEMLVPIHGKAAESYWMDPDRWDALRGSATLPCAVCFDGDTLTPCPSMTLRSGGRERAIDKCGGTRSD
jgi:hypothetical protein